MKLRYYLLTAAYCAGIFWLSSLPDPVPIKYRPFGSDWAAHIVMFGGLALIISLGIRRSGKPTPALAQFLIPLTFAILYGVSDEIHQSFVPQRTCALSDMLADAIGAFTIQAYLCHYRWSLLTIPGLPRRPA
ncbi:MAG: VanZ family protein [Candidatus Hydrogenedentes bacterium]|nr:VanZ family protein [Candidatus Hydrogenedentota bacterium]